MGLSRRDIVARAIEFRSPPRLPFFQHALADVPDDVCDCWEMDRARNGWFFDRAAPDDWGCIWARTEQDNMGQVVGHPLADWNALKDYRPPDPRDAFYYERLEDEMHDAGDRYVTVTCHFGLMERLHMLHGFEQTLIDFYLAPDRIDTLLDMILQYKIEQFDELHRRFGESIDGLFLTDDWGTQQNTFVRSETFERFFLERYRELVGAIHDHGWHAILHSCGRINDFVPYFVDLGVDVMNMQQPQTYGIEELGRIAAGRIAFLATGDIQATLPSGDAAAVRQEVQDIVKQWSTPDGGLIAFDYGDPGALGVAPEMRRVMFDAFLQADRWRGPLRAGDSV